MTRAMQELEISGDTEIEMRSILFITHYKPRRETCETAQRGPAY